MLSCVLARLQFISLWTAETTHTRRTLPQLLHCLYVSALTDFCLSGLGAVLEYSPVLCGPLRYLPQHDLRLCAISGKAISNKAFVIHFCAHTGFINMVWSDFHPRRTLLCCPHKGLHGDEVGDAEEGWLLWGTENGGANSVVVISALVVVMHCLCHLYCLCWFCLWLRQHCDEDLDQERFVNVAS